MAAKSQKAPTISHPTGRPARRKQPDIDVEWPFGVSFRELRNGYCLPVVFFISVDDPAYPYILQLGVEHVEMRGWDCFRLVCNRRPGEAPIRTDGLRSVPVQRLLDAGLSLAIHKKVKDKAGKVEYVNEPGFFTEGEIAFVYEYPDETVEGGRRPRLPGPSSDELRQVAIVYKTALEMPGQPAPTRAVQQHFNISYSTAAKRVMAAREAGWLRKAPKKGQAGEQPIKRTARRSK